MAEKKGFPRLDERAAVPYWIDWTKKSRERVEIPPKIFYDSGLQLL